MPEFAELKQQAEALEAAGKTREALGLYRLAIREIQGTPAMLRELALLAKVGDLHETLGEHAEACDAWEQAGRQYAEHGSAQGVVALCTKIHRVDRTRTIVYPQLARVLVDHGHIIAARSVLLKYTERAQAKRATDVLTKLEDQSDAQMRPGIERVLEAVLKAEETRARRRAEDQAQAPAHAPEPEPEPEPEPDPEPLPAPEPDIVHDTASDTPAPPRTSIASSWARTSEEREVPSEPAPEPEPHLEPEPTPAPARPPAPADSAWASPLDTGRGYRPSRPSAPAPRPARSPALLVGSGAIGGLLFGILLSQFGIIPRFGGDDDGSVATPPPVVPIVAPPVDTAVGDTTVRDTTPAAPVTPVDTAAADTAVPDPTPVVPPPDTTPAAAPALPALGGGEFVVEDPIAVDGFPIARVVEHQVTGVSGYRVFQPMGGADTLVLTAVPLLDPAMSEIPVVTDGAPSTGLRAYGGMRVDVQAPVSADSLRVLLERLGGGGG